MQIKLVCKPPILRANLRPTLVGRSNEGVSCEPFGFRLFSKSLTTKRFRLAWGRAAGKRKDESLPYIGIIGYFATFNIA